MYENNEKKFSLWKLLKTILYILGSIIIILAIILLITKCSNKKVVEPPKIEYNLKEQLKQLEMASLKHFTKENLPVETNVSKTIKLRYLINQNYTTKIKDQNGTVCDANSSYSEVTKLDNNYALKSYILCGQHADYEIIYIGCFADCENGDICEKTEETTGGICTVQTNQTENNSAHTSQSQTNNSSSNTSGSPTITPVPERNPEPVPETKPTPVPNEEPVKTLYEYKKCTDVYICSNGTLDTSNNKCKVNVTKTENGAIISGTITYAYSCPSGYSYNSSKHTCEMYINQTYVSDTKCVTSTNKAPSGYTFVKYDAANKCYQFTGGYYTCSYGTASNGKCLISDGSKLITTSSVTPPSCQDSSFTYNSSTNTCTKQVTTYAYEEPSIKKDCTTTWSYSDYLSGWVKTGNTR